MQLSVIDLMIVLVTLLIIVFILVVRIYCDEFCNAGYETSRVDGEESPVEEARS